MRLTILALTCFSTLCLAAPECLIDAKTSPVDGGRFGLLALISGEAKGFLPKEPVFVTVTNGGKEYTMQASRTGKWALVYANLEEATNVLCWQGFPARLTAESLIVNP